MMVSSEGDAGAVAVAVTVVIASAVWVVAVASLPKLFRIVAVVVVVLR